MVRTLLGLRLGRRLEETDSALAWIPRQRTVSPGSECSQMVARQTREGPEAVGGDIKSRSERTCSSRKWVTKHRCMVATFAPLFSELQSRGYTHIGACTLRKA